MRLQCSVSDDLRVAVECGNQVGGQEIDADANDFRKGDGAEDAEACASFGTVILLCAEVLTDKSSQCQRKQVIGKSRSPRPWNRHRSQPLPFFQSC